MSGGPRTAIAESLVLSRSSLASIDLIKDMSRLFLSVVVVARPGSTISVFQPGFDSGSSPGV